MPLPILKKMQSVSIFPAFFSASITIAHSQYLRCRLVILGCFSRCQVEEFPASSPITLGLSSLQWHKFYSKLFILSPDILIADFNKLNFGLVVYKDYLAIFEIGGLAKLSIFFIEYLRYREVAKTL